MTFLQLIDCRTDRFDEMNRLMDTWAEQTRGRRTATHEVIGRDRSDGAHFVEIVEFPSYEEAMRNSRLPETDRVFREMAALCEAMPTFTDLDVVRDEAFNEEIMRRFYEEVAVGGDIDVIDELYVPDHVDHDVAKEANTTVGRDVLKRDVTRWREAFDFDFTLDRQIAEGDTVVTLWTWRGRHRGEFMGLAPTGRECTMTGTTVCRFRDGRIHESWWHYDIPRLVRELGAAQPA